MRSKNGDSQRMFPLRQESSKATEPAKAPRALKPVMTDARGVAEMLHCDLAKVWRLHEDGWLPSPIAVGGEERWRIAEIREWVAAKCPNRDTWEQQTTRPSGATETKKPRRSPSPMGYDNFTIPPPGKSVFAWAKEMEHVFRTSLVVGMEIDGEAEGYGKEFATWDEAQARTVCLKVISYLRGLPSYRGQYEYLFRKSLSDPPW